MELSRKVTVNRLLWLSQRQLLQLDGEPGLVSVEGLSWVMF